MELKRVVVTGIGALTPIGNNLQDYWKNLVMGVSGAAPITHFDTSEFKTKFACELKNFDAAEYLDRRELRRLDEFSQYAIIAADEAIKDAGLFENDSINKDRFGVIWSSGIGGINVFQQEIGGFFTGNGTPRFNPFFIPKMIIDIAPGHISMRHGLRGPNFSVVSACASSTNGMIDAFNYIRLGMADIFVTGGSEAAISPSVVGGFSSMKVLSTKNEEPQSSGVPFSSQRDGFVIGEGSAAMVLEKESYALKRNAPAKAYFIGGFHANDAGHITSPEADGKGAATCILNAAMHAGIEMDEIDAYYSHGTSTILGDISEYNALKQLFGEDLKYLPIIATKGATGHLLGASASIEAVLSVEMIARQMILPCHANYIPDEKMLFPSLFLFEKASLLELRNVLNHASGFGGQHASTIFSKI